MAIVTTKVVGAWRLTTRSTARSLSITAEDEGQPYGSITLSFNADCPDGPPAATQAERCLLAALAAYDE